MPQPRNPQALGEQILQVPVGDRWRIYHRLQELMIPCSCPVDGSLRVEINNSIALILLHSTVMQFTATRTELINWLERCWMNDE
ncbi:MAG: hypothetical protein QNJ47_06315 [Nostocaceae cyanobacterium]|nr:hypothetical protein [Nostocaceae cyanobacterium]